MTEALRAAAVARETGFAIHACRDDFHTTCPACR